MYSHIVIVITAMKLFFMPVYHSTDFEVHRNWLAVTFNLPIEKWYYEATSEWTLDYPPFFAWLEYAHTFLAKYFDAKMLELYNFDYKSDMTILFQKLSLICLDFIYILGVSCCTTLLSRGEQLAFILLVSNPGLLMVDHIHFQYNGFMYGMLMISISQIIKARYLQGALWFAVLLNFKHIFLYIAPVYIVYLFRAYCFTVASVDGVHTHWISFSIFNLIKLGLIVVAVFAASFGPFMDHLPQLFLRMFPFKRGLCHAYWAPNFWALYSFGDKVLQQALPKFGVNVTHAEASMTGGLVQEYKHAVLPSVTPLVTFVITVASMAPALCKLWNLCADRRYRAMSFVRCIIVCATCSFMFSWHVHEKAILMTLIPLRCSLIASSRIIGIFILLQAAPLKHFMCVLGETDAKLFLFLSTVGHYSLFPLLYPASLLGIKLLLLLTHVAIAFGNIPSLYEVTVSKKVKSRPMMRLPMLNYVESLYLYGLLLLCFYENALHVTLGLHKSLPFLPLMLTSVYCALGVLYFWVAYYHYFLTFNLSWVTPSLLRYQKKTS